MAPTRSRGRARSGRTGGHNKAHPLGAVEFFTRPEQHIVWQVLGFLVRARAELFIATTLVVVFIVVQAWVTPTPDDEPSMFEPPHIALLIMVGACDGPARDPGISPVPDPPNVVCHHPAPDAVLLCAVPHDDPRRQIAVPAVVPALPRRGTSPSVDPRGAVRQGHRRRRTQAGCRLLGP